jgi:hypothetical protein
VLQRHPRRDRYRDLLQQAAPQLSPPARQRLTLLLDEPTP